jgi:O-antigen chain-terminating methyltransferase
MDDAEDRGASMIDSLYRAFEDRYRGSRELIKSRLEIYLPFVAPLKAIYDAPEVLDVGCGRGEWLELLQSNGFLANGVDLDEGMLLACRELGLDVAQADALDYIKGLGNESQSVVSAFHVVEHLSFEYLRQVVDEAHRVLKPGGLLILETPNPENLLVASSDFYLDPTHLRPVPAQLLTFVVEHAGFGRVKTLYLQESPALATSLHVNLYSVLGGVSPDYAVVAQKTASVEVCALFESAFDRTYGVSLNALAERYDQQAETKASQTRASIECLQNEFNNTVQRVESLIQLTAGLEARLDSEQQRDEQLRAELNAARKYGEHLEARAQWLQNEWDAARKYGEHLEARAQWLQNEWDAAKAKIDELNHSSQHWWTIADALNKQLQVVYSSKSWRITWPLRQAMRAGKWVVMLHERTFRWVLRLPTKLAEPLMVWAVGKIITNPELKAGALRKLAKYPKLKQSLRNFAVRSGLLHGWGTSSPTSWLPEQSPSGEKSDEIAPLQITVTKLPKHLSPRAARIYSDLQKAIAARRS